MIQKNFGTKVRPEILIKGGTLTIPGQSIQLKTKLHPVMHVKNLFLNFFYMGLDQVIGELMYRFQGRDNNIICGLGEIYLGENVKTDQFEKVSKFCNLNSELLQCNYRL